MKAVIMQPNYLPWMGYFDLMDQCDAFVFLDHVQHIKRDWEQRNRIKSPSGELWLSIPVLSKGKYHQKINEVVLDNSQQWKEKHLQSIKINYAKAPFFEKYFNELGHLYSQEITKLIDISIPLTLWIKKIIGLNCQVFYSSNLNPQGKKSELLCDICRKIGADEYLSPVGAKDYIDADNHFIKNNIKLEYQNFEHPVYDQLWGDFISHLSVIDLIFNEGPNSLNVIRSGRKNV
ncbi:MAG: WbqC family protein [Candidatus Paceibacterota bacterium]